MPRRSALREPPVHIGNLRPHPYDWANDPEMRHGPYTLRATATMPRLNWMIVLIALRKSDNSAVRDMADTLERELHT